MVPTSKVGEYKDDRKIYYSCTTFKFVLVSRVIKRASESNSICVQTRLEIELSFKHTYLNTTQIFFYVV